MARPKSLEKQLILAAEPIAQLVDPPDCLTQSSGRGLPACACRASSSLGRAPHSHCGGKGFDSPLVHQAQASRRGVAFVTAAIIRIIMKRYPCLALSADRQAAGRLAGHCRGHGFPATLNNIRKAGYRMSRYAGLRGTNPLVYQFWCWADCEDRGLEFPRTD